MKHQIVIKKKTNIFEGLYWDLNTFATFKAFQLQWSLFQRPCTNPVTPSSWVTRYQLVFLLVQRAAESSKQSNSGRVELTLQQCPLCPGLTLYLPACSLIPCQDKPLCWVTVLVAKQSALVFNILQSACIGLAVSQGSLTHTTVWGPTPYPISANERRVCWLCVLRATWGCWGEITGQPSSIKERRKLNPSQFSAGHFRAAVVSPPALTSLTDRPAGRVLLHQHSKSCGSSCQHSCFK